MNNRFFQLCDLIKSLNIKYLINILKVHRDMLKYGRGYMVSQCFSALSNIGFFNELSQRGKLNLTEYTDRNNIDLKTLNSICDYLYAIHILDKKDNFYMWSSKGGSLFELSLGLFDMLYGYAPIFQELESILKKEKVYNRDVKRREKYMAKGSAGITRYLPFPVTQQLIKKYNRKHILDLGCGTGEFLFNLAKKNTGSNTKYYGIDISSEAIGHAKEIAKKMSIDNIVELEICSIFELNKVKRKWPEIDIMTCMFVMHEFLFEGRHIVIGLLKDIKKNFEGCLLIICELCKQPLETIRKKPTAVAEHHLFHDLSNQLLITNDEWKNLFREAGYDLVEEKRFDFAGQSYFVIK